MPTAATQPAATTTATAGLLERFAHLDALGDLAERTRSDGRGRLALVAGEAGIGKTALVREFTANHPDARVLAGACDALHTPRPLGPLLDIADEAGGPLAALASDGATPSTLVAALHSELKKHARNRATVLILEDLHWADGATLDVLRLLARRLDSIPALVIATYRDDELDRSHPLRILLGELPRRTAHRISLKPLSPAAVATLADRAHRADHAALHEKTAGNPFFVTEVLAAADPGDVPDTVRDAVLARAARLDHEARTLLDAVAILPHRAELWLLDSLTDGHLSALDACLSSGMLRAARQAVAFRHEIARVAIEDSLSPHTRLALHRKALAALADPPDDRPDPARLAHHAEAADDARAVLEHAPQAGENAARLGSHREAAAQFARALRYARDLPAARRAQLLERRSYECYLIDRIDDAIDARRQALHEHHRANHRRKEGDAHRWLSRLAWFAGDNATAEREAFLAVEMLEPLEPGPELAMAYSNVAQLRMLASDRVGATMWGERAIELADRLGETEILVHALNNVGSAALVKGDPTGRAKLERSLELALHANLEEHVARAYTNLGSIAVDQRDYARADAYLALGIAYSAERDLDAWVSYMQGYRARSDLDQGRFDDAAATASAVLDHPGIPVPTRITPLVVIGRLRARRGDPDPWSPLDEARDLARGTGELQRLVAVAVARAEARWLAGENDRIDEETKAALTLALEHRHDLCAVGELAVWRRRAGLHDALDDDSVAETCRLELAGKAHEAARRWRDIGCPYEAALALAHADDHAQRRALAQLQKLGARPAATRVARALRERGVRDLRSGPRAATRDNPAGMTARELEVVVLVAEGMRNADIATKLFLSEKTVAHHVSAILRKLDVGTRGQASAEAARLGLVER